MTKDTTLSLNRILDLGDICIIIQKIRQRQRREEETVYRDYRVVSCRWAGVFFII